MTVVPAEARRVAIVNISDEDYARLFNSRSPLDYAVLRRLVDAVARGGAKVIGVDIDTSDASFTHIMAEQRWPPIVWARAVVIGSEGEILELKPALGGQPLPPGHHAAPPVLPEDSDNVTRRYRRVVTVNGEDIPTFNWSLYSLFVPAEAAARGPLDESLYVRFAGDTAATHRLHIPASQLLEMSKDAGWASGDLVRDKIVIIGGTYLGQDRHQTPLGLMAGVDVVASATETELMGGGFKPPSNWLKFLLTLFDGVLLVVLFHRVGFKKAILYSLLLIPALALLCSLVAYRGLSGWLYFAPTLVIVLVHQVVEHVKDYRKAILNRSVEMVEGAAPPDK